MSFERPKRSTGLRFSSPRLLPILSIVATACGGAAQKGTSTPSEYATNASAAPTRPEAAPQPGAGVPENASPPSDAAGSRTRAESSPSGSPPSNPPAQLAAAASEDAELVRAKRMVDIEAHLRIEVERVAEAARRLREIANRSEGRIASETTTEDTPSTARAEFTLRVPIGRSDDVFLGIDALGVMRSRDVRTHDIGKEYYDSVLRLRNLQVTRDRMEQILKQATALNDILTVEAQLTRLRGEMEQIEGQLRYMKDRAAFATIFVTLFMRQSAQPVPDVIVKPEAKFFPGLHGSTLLDVRGDGSTASYYGAGFGVGISRRFDLQLDGFRRFDHAEGALDAFMATLGGRFYSEYLGGGTRRFLEPYLGLRGGYARFEQKNEFVTGITLGLELWKTETVRVELGVPALVLFGTGAGAHAVVAPTLGVDIAF